MKKLYMLVILVLFVPILFLGFFTDANVFAYIGRLITDGGVPYVDAWDHKGISIYLINAIGYGVFGFKSFIGIRILELLLILYAFSRFFDQIKREQTAMIAFMAGIFGLFTLKYFFDGGNLTEEYGTIFSLLSILLLLKKNARVIDYALVGAFFVINFTIRANLIGFWIALFLFYITQLLLKEKSIKDVFLSFLKMGYGAATIALLLGTYLWATNSFNEFVDAAFTFNFSYSGASFSETFSAILASIKKYHLSMILIVGWIVSILRFSKNKSRFIELLLIFWIPIELYLSNLSNRLYSHYFLMWVPLMMFSILVILTELKERFSLSKVKLILGSALIFMICFYVPTYITLKDWKKVWVGEENANKENINHIAENYPDSSILVWGNDAYIYNGLKKTSPVSYFYQSIFKYDTELTRQKMREFTDQVLEKSPDVIIDTKRSGMIALDGSNALEVDKGQRENLQGFLEIIKNSYELVEENNGLTYYKLKKNE